MEHTINTTFAGIDIFCGAGGMSLGAQWAGVYVHAAVEIDPWCALTYRKHHATTEVIMSDIKKVDPKKWIDFHPFIVFGGPPCQGFSSSNTKTRTLENPKNWMFKEYIRFIKELRPTWFVFENVPGFKNFKNGAICKELESALAKLEYEYIYSNILNAADFGVPQLRKRFFMIGNNQGIRFIPPAARKIIVTVKEALSDLPSLQNGGKFDELPYKEIKNLSEYASLMRCHSQKAKQNFVSRNKEYIIQRYQYIKPGQNWEAIPHELMQNYKDLAACHSGIYKRLDPDQPSVVIANFRKNMLIHPYEHRGLSLREAARLQSFPDDCLFSGPLESMQQQIGNAVPPLLAKAVFEQIIHLSDKR